MTSSIVPAHFQPHQRRSPVTDAWLPLYSHTIDSGVTIGLVVAEAHCNGRELLHGGVIASLADNAMGLSAIHVASVEGRPNLSGLTTSLSVDYLAPAATGTWVEFQSRVHRIGASSAVVDCLVVDGGNNVIGRANATFALKQRREQ